MMNSIKEYRSVDGYLENVGLCMCTVWKVALVGALYLAVAAPHLFAAEQTQATHQDSGHYHHNVVELLLGNTYEDTDHGSENGFTVGYTYERRLSELLGVGGFYEYAAGTGMPTARRSQAATCFLVELGDGQKFLFDIGSGSHANLQALMIPSDFLTKVFLTHLHTDHWGDLTSLWAGGWTAGRTGPLEVWGPSGAREDMGTKYAVENMLKAYNWDYMTRAVTINPTPGQIIVHEFDYKGLNEVVYEEKGVTSRSFPTIHTGDGPVSYSLEWNGYKIVIGGDTAPNK